MLIHFSCLLIIAYSYLILLTRQHRDKSLYGLSRKGAVVGHVKDIRYFGGIEWKEALGVCLQCARICRPQVGGEEDFPVPGKGFGRYVYVNPERTVSVGDDIPDMEVSVQTGVRFGRFVYESQGASFEFFWDKILFPVEADEHLLVRAKSGSVGPLGV